nr:MAG TPA: protein of unknown function DUF1424 [Inoviridae sp.]
MQRIIGRDIYEGKISDEHEVILHDLGHGQKEASISRSVWWEHTGTMSEEAYAMYLEAVERLNNDPDWLAEKEAKNRERSARRAKTKVRRICKTMGVDALLTLTYQANMQDLDACKKHMKEFVRRIRRLIPDFVYVAAFEQQKRGAWHVHMAVRKLPFKLAASNGVKVGSYNVIRAVWRRVVGELGGNIDEARKKRHSRKSPAQMASYISKYILKAFEEGEDHSNRYSSSAYCLPAPQRMRFMAESMADLIALVYCELGMPGTITNPWVSAWGDRFFMTSEPDPGGLIVH